MVEHPKSLLLGLTIISILFIYFPAEGTSHWILLGIPVKSFFRQNLWKPHTLHPNAIPVSSQSLSSHFRLFNPKRKAVAPLQCGNLLLDSRLTGLDLWSFWNFARRFCMAFIGNHQPHWFSSPNQQALGPWTPNSLLWQDRISPWSWMFYT